MKPGERSDAGYPLIAIAAALALGVPGCGSERSRPAEPGRSTGATRQVTETHVRQARHGLGDRAEMTARVTEGRTAEQLDLVAVPTGVLDRARSRLGRVPGSRWVRIKMTISNRGRDPVYLGSMAVTLIAGARSFGRTGQPGSSSSLVGRLSTGERRSGSFDFSVRIGVRPERLLVAPVAGARPASWKLDGRGHTRP
jgi:hypothetical protein